MDKESLIKAFDEKQLDLFRYLKIVIRQVDNGITKSGFHNISDIRKMMEKEIVKMEKWLAAELNE